jgi:serine/threonine-protein kinase
MVRAIGRYRILERLATGGMADVFRAEIMGAEGVRKEVALKLVRGEHAGSSEFVAMFVREARLAARLTHANVVQIFEFGQAEGRHYIAMELVRGHHLGRVADRCRELGLRFGTARAVFVAAEVATALAYAHQPAADGSPGLVHRDVSPHNVLLSWEGEVKLADFGIARAASRAGLTRPGTLEGKLAYMAPEQARGEAADARADLFALGVVLWELLTGTRLFARDTEAATLDLLLRGPVPSAPSAWNEGIPPALDALVLRCLERDPERRAASARELAAELRTLLLQLARSPLDWELRSLMQRLWTEGQRESVRAPEPTRRRAPPEPEPEPEPIAPVAAEPAEDETRTLAVAPRGAHRWRRRAALAAAILAALAGGGAWRAYRRGGVAPAPPARVAPAAVSASAPRESPSSPAGAVAPASAGAAPAPVRSATIYGMPLPPPAAGEGLLSVNAVPWATLVVDGRTLGDTPREVRLPAGRHRVRAEHPRLGSVEGTVEIVAGRRTGWYPRLGR